MELQRRQPLPRYLKSLCNAILQRCPPFPSKEFLQEPFCILGGDNFSQITSIISRRFRNQRIIRSQLSNDRDHISEVHWSSKSKESSRDRLWIEEARYVETGNVDNITVVFCFCMLVMITHQSITSGCALTWHKRLKNTSISLG